MGGWGDDCVEWGKLYLGEGCCEDTEQEVVMASRILAECKRQNVRSRLATGSTGSNTDSMGEAEKGTELCRKVLPGRTDEGLQMSASRIECGITWVVTVTSN